jgi:hypothetical protein
MTFFNIQIGKCKINTTSRWFLRSIIWQKRLKTRKVRKKKHSWNHSLMNTILKERLKKQKLLEIIPKTLMVRL